MKEILYRVVIFTSGSEQPGRGTTFYDKDVKYCGYDVDEALRVKCENAPLDYWCGYGNRARHTKLQSNRKAVKRVNRKLRTTLIAAK